MKKVIALCVVLALIVSPAMVGCGGAPNNKVEKTDTAGKKPPKDSASETEASETGAKRETAAGGEAKTASPPDAP